MHATHKACGIDGCPRPHRSRGYCATHYRRLARHGDARHGGDILRQHATDVPCEFCAKLTVARGMCENHYRRWKKWGDPFGGQIRVGVTALDRFWAKIDKNGPFPIARPDLGPCWLWTDAPNGAGYGTLGVGGRPVMAHRYSWLIAGNALDPVLTIDHLCRVRLCVNPGHLDQVTHAENLARARKANHDRNPERVGSGRTTV